jgi:hypothetical protein
MKSPLIMSLFGTLFLGALILGASFFISRDFRETVLFVFNGTSQTQLDESAQLAEEEQANKMLEDADIPKQLNTMIEQQTELYEKENPGSGMDIKAILQQTSDLSLLSAALRAHQKSTGVYPSRLEDLIPEYLPEMILPSQKIPTDASGASFEYHLREGGLGWLICHDNLEEGGRDCFGTNKEGELVRE